MDAKTITIVSGLPRSGTSMLMRMLEAGGMPVLTDHIRTADEDNPGGYYEFERVKQIEHDRAWLPEAQGRAIKLISALLKHLPAEYAYRVIFVRREMKEVLASQRQMLVRRNKPGGQVSDERLAELFSRHLEQVEYWLARQPNMKVLYVRYSDILADPVGQAGRINQFLGGSLEVKKMAKVVDYGLYRQRR